MSGLSTSSADVADQQFDVVIVGGGITGAGIARHSALAGLSTLLIEAADFASGTSSRSTKLIHGGLRYLAMGDIALVRESALERKSLRAMAPQLTQPKWMVVPATSRAGLLKLRAGIATYEKLGAVDAVDRHVNWGVKELAIEEPLFNTDLYPYACAYREYLTDDARLVVATLRSAADHGAQICNYVKLISHSQSGSMVDLVIEDVVSAARSNVRARVLVNAAGPWVEEVSASSSDRVNAPSAPGSSSVSSSGVAGRLHLSKGVHIGVPHQRLPIKNMVMMTADDKRPVFAIPRGTVTYIGTTDTTESGGPNRWPEVTGGDVDYLLQPVRRQFRDAELARGDVVSSWAGLRALINQPGRAPKEMSRKDEIWSDGRIVTIAGGKLTGFRKMAEQVMARVGVLLDKSVVLEDPLKPLPGGDRQDVEALEAEVAARYSLDALVAMRLTRLYGSEIFEVLGETPQAISKATFAEEIRWSVQREGAKTLEDVVYRRLRTPWFRPEDTEAVSNASAEIMAPLLKWSEQEQGEQLNLLTRRLQWDLAFARS